jgi:peptidoglycan/LPS O-acetylase OafA/YrhL
MREASCVFTGTHVGHRREADKMSGLVTAKTPPAEGAPRPPFIVYLEGMRGLLGLSIVLGHFRFLLDINDRYAGPTASLLPGRGMIFAYGGSVVCAFIVLSGFVLTIPVAKRGGGVEFWRFIKSRARRMIPAYYAAIALAVPLYIWQLELDHIPVTFRHVAIQVVSHLLFLQDLSGTTLEGLDGAMWSICVEWQAYLVFALLLIPLQKKYGLIAPILAGFGLGFVPTIVARFHHVPYGLQVAHLWYFGIFALGSAASFIAFSPDRYAYLQRARVWNVVAVLSLVAYLALVAPTFGEFRVPTNPLFDIPIGIGLASWFLALALDERVGKRPAIVRFFSIRALVWLGTFSYSLYLTHQPFVEVIMRLAQVLPPTTRIWVPLITMPFIVAFAYGFAMLFEYPFMSAYYRAGEAQALRGPEHAPVRGVENAATQN